MSAGVRRIDGLSDAATPAFDTDLAREARLVARDALPGRPVDRSQMLLLGGSIRPPAWAINGATRRTRLAGEVRPLLAPAFDAI